VIPWSGEVFGTADIAFVAGKSRPFVIAPVGMANAGKTTLLASLYLHLSRGAQFPGRQFAGSYTLEAWEKIAHTLKWQIDQHPKFPPHTSRTDDRTPGLLHLSLNAAVGSTRDILLVDAPGEWFASWAESRDSIIAEPARWIVERADALLLMVDMEALAGKEAAAAIFDLRQLALRLRDLGDQTPVAVLWSKADIEVPDDTVNSVSAELCAILPSALHYRVIAAGKVRQDEKWIHPFLAGVSQLLNRMPDTEPLALSDQGFRSFGDAFLAYRGRM
jgi:hypothetical protein